MYRHQTIIDKNTHFFFLTRKFNNYDNKVLAHKPKSHEPLNWTFGPHFEVTATRNAEPVTKLGSTFFFLGFKVDCANR
jgi:hypothetical protein